MLPRKLRGGGNARRFDRKHSKHNNYYYCPPIGGSFGPAGCVPLTWMVLEFASV